MEDDQEFCEKACRLLYGRANGKPRCAWECGKGWHGALKKMSIELEWLNMQLYGAARVYVNAAQTKEKFGWLRFYYDVVRDMAFPVRLAQRTILGFAEFLKRSLDFKTKTVELRKARRCRNVAVISDAKYEELLNGPNGGDVFKSGKFCFSSMETVSPARLAVVPTRHKFLYRLAYEKLPRLAGMMYTAPTAGAQAVMEYANVAADDIVSKYEKICHGLCEVCGRQIGDRYSPRCETKGWIRYVCEKCAKENGWKYEAEGGDENQA